MAGEMKLARNPIAHRHTSPVEKPVVENIQNEPSDIEEETEEEYSIKDDLPSNKTDLGKLSELKASSNKKTPQRTEKEQSKLSYYLYIISILFACIAYIVYSYYTSSNPVHMQTKNVSAIIENLYQLHVNQSSWTFKILSAELEKIVVKDDPPSPAVLTILANPGAVDTAKKFCEHLAKMLAVENYILIDKSIYGQGNGSEIKIKIDDKIQTHVDDSSLNAVVVDHLEKIPLNATMIFHNYCDHENASFKRVVYMFILSLNEDLKPNSSPKDLDHAAIQQYKDTWSSSHPDDIDSLITRLTVAVINIQKENFYFK